MRIHPEAISPGRWPLLNHQKLELSWIHFLNEIPLEIRDWQGYTRIWLTIVYNTIFIIEGKRMFLFAQSFKRPQRLNLKEPGSFVVMWIPQFWRCFCQRKLEKVHFSGNFDRYNYLHWAFSDYCRPSVGTPQSAWLEFIYCMHLFLYLNIIYILSIYICWNWSGQRFCHWETYVDGKESQWVHQVW